MIQDTLRGVRRDSKGSRIEDHNLRERGRRRTQVDERERYQNPVKNEFKSTRESGPMT